MIRQLRIWGPAVLWALGLFLLSEIRGAPSGLEPLLAIPDKLVHFALYAVFGALLARGRWAAGALVPSWQLLTTGLVFAATDEWHQSFVPGRTPELRDWIADGLGLALGYLIVTRIVARRWPHYLTNGLRNDTL